MGVEKFKVLTPSVVNTDVVAVPKRVDDEEPTMVPLYNPIVN